MKIISISFGLAALIFFLIGSGKAYIKETMDSADYLLIAITFALASTMFKGDHDNGKEEGNRETP